MSNIASNTNQVSIKSLARLQFRQFSKGSKTEITGRIFIVAYLWVLSLLFFFLAKDSLQGVPPLLLGALFLGMAVPDFLFKLIFERDNTVMDAFLKTRPISQERWNSFLGLSQFWNPSNLEMPLIMALPCFLFLPFLFGLITLLILYLLSVLGGFLVMLFKHRGVYLQEKEVALSRHNSKALTTGHNRFGLQYKSLLRSKRMKTLLIILVFFTLQNYVFQSLVAESNQNAQLMLLVSILYSAIHIQQWGLGIEASYWGTIGTKPVSISKILEDKYLLGIILCSIVALVCLPLCIWLRTPLLTLLAYTLYSGGFGGILLLIDAYRCTPFDLFGKAFFNHQGAAGTYRASTFLGLILGFGLPIAIQFLVPDPFSCFILMALGIIGFLVHRPILNNVERKYINNKHKYIDKFISYDKA